MSINETTSGSGRLNFSMTSLIISKEKYLEKNTDTFLNKRRGAQKAPTIFSQQTFKHSSVDVPVSVKTANANFIRMTISIYKLELIKQRRFCAVEYNQQYPQCQGDQIKGAKYGIFKEYGRNRV
eukprot:TRINITY_DN1352_c0_g1_i3.p3 TRINITY_DN1352_c0_g1~~TRINITY_DN1352_c0_g1_i3.p3  ORF type:complete len:124 (+),score=3.05 TRINITY_DN1352_c0_g1_i3:401-772(+)